MHTANVDSKAKPLGILPLGISPLSRDKLGYSSSAKLGKQPEKISCGMIFYGDCGIYKFLSNAVACDNSRQTLTQSLTHPLTHSTIYHALTYSLTFPLSQSASLSLTRLPPTHPLILPLTHSPFHSLIHSLIHLFIHPVSHSPVQLRPTSLSRPCPPMRRPISLQASGISTT